MSPNEWELTYIFTHTQPVSANPKLQCRAGVQFINVQFILVPDLWITAVILDLFSDMKWNEIQSDYQATNRRRLFYGYVTAGSCIFKKRNLDPQFFRQWRWIQNASTHYFSDSLVSWLSVCVTKKRATVYFTEWATGHTVDERWQRILNLDR